MKRIQLVPRILITSVMVGVLCLTLAHAKKPGPAADAAYTITPFMLPNVATLSSGVNDINEQGNAVGWVELQNGDIVAIHRSMATGAYATLLSIGDAAASGVNNQDQIVGQDGKMSAFWNSPTAVPVVLPPLDPIDPLSEVSSWATNINDAGIVVGASEERFLDGDGQLLKRIKTAVVWRVILDNAGAHVDGPRPLFPLNGHMESFAGNGCLNEFVDGFAQVSGWSASHFVDPGDPPPPPSAAVVWSISLNPDGTLALPGPAVNIGVAGASEGLAVNNFGDVCGRSDKLPVLALSGQLPQILPVPRDTKDGYALEVNDNADVVGELDIRKTREGQTSPSRWHAFMWRNGEAIELAKQIQRNSGWDELNTANTINNDGIIGGSGSFDVSERGFLLIPVKP